MQKGHALTGPPATANERLLDRAIRHATYLENLKAHERRRILLFLDRQVFPELMDRLQSRLERIRLRGSDSGVETTRRYREMMAAVDGAISGGLQNGLTSFASTLDRVALTEAQWQAAVLAEAVPVAMDFRTPSPALLRSIVRSRPFRGRHLQEWWSSIDRSARRRVRDEIRIGLTEGESTDQIVRRIRGTRAARYTDGALQITRHHAESVVRTAVNHVTTRAREAVYQENRAVKGVQWVSTLDSRTSVTCMSLDGRVFAAGRGPRPPAHIRCRSTTVPVLKSWRELGIKLPEAPTGTRASLDGQVAGDIAYPDWLRRQPAAFQDDVLGPKRAKLFRSGKVPIERMVDRFNRPLSLEQIARREGLSAA